MAKQAGDKGPKERWPHLEVAPEVEKLVVKANKQKQQKKYFNTAMALRALEAMGEEIPKEIKAKYAHLLV